MEDVLVKNVELARQLERMEREHEETMKELFESNGDLTKKVNDLEQRNNELFERCKLLNKNRFINVDLDSEKKRLEKEILEIKKMHELKEKSMIAQMNELRSHNSELLDDKNMLDYELRSVRDKNYGLERANARLSVDLQTATGKIRKLSNEMSSLDDQTSTLRWQNQSLSSQRDRLTRDLAISQEKLVTAERNAVETRDEIIRMKTKNSDGISYELSDHCFCSICCEGYDSFLYVPRMLRCGHTFCEHCCNKLRTEDAIKCPTCKCVGVYASGDHPSKNFFAISVAEETLKPVSKANCETCHKLSFDQKRKEREENKIETEKMEE